MNEEDPVVERLDRLIALVSLAFADEISRARTTARSDEVNDAVLNACAEGWTPAKVVAAAATKAGASPSTMKRRIAELIGVGALKRRGATSTVEYRATGIY